MKLIEEVTLFQTKKDIFSFLFTAFTIFLFSISYQYYKYTELTKFDSQLVNAVVLKQYTKTKLTKKGKTKTYQVLKLKSDDGFTFYTTAKKKLQNLQNKNIQLEIWAGKITFYEYLRNFFAFSKILQIYDKPTLMSDATAFISSQHQDANMSNLYQALFLAKPLNPQLQKTFSNLGISHLIAISGFHLGVLSAILFFLIKYPYKFLQNRYFPYRSYTKDTFIIIALILFSYLLFLDFPPSLLRAYAMLVIAYILYARGIKIISMQTLLITVVFLLALFPKLIFSIGFWLSVSGVFYIFLFLIHFKHYSKVKQFILLPFWVYLMMLPYSLAIFGNFSLYHPLSILWTTLFTLFYPLEMFLHLISHGSLLDGLVQKLVEINLNAVNHTTAFSYLIIEVLLSFIAIFSRRFLYVLLLYTFLIFIYSIYNVA
ncbi:ComEC/Rec2 family competence protein [Sulfurimonas sp.]|uniref:ComEC/Rec2 family competence protein n=1 Tax=Sulfurimonas sp. TaxID=2022749 RepID=UPI0026287667|nr:ComEC/Rec2 family competence protein [Sulfurimonas sp.]